jgi:hypothetical protein
MGAGGSLPQYYGRVRRDIKEVSSLVEIRRGRMDGDNIQRKTTAYKENKPLLKQNAFTVFKLRSLPPVATRDFLNETGR